MLLFFSGMLIGGFLSIVGCIVWAYRAMDAFEHPSSRQRVRPASAVRISELDPGTL
jgi:hypothetical protein